MKTLTIRASLFVLFMVPALVWAQTAESKSIKLNEPDKKRGLPVMEALSLRASARDWSDKELSLRDLSDLLWAANGINRPDTSKKRTAASAQNAQDVDVYVFRKDGVYRYNAAEHALTLVITGDFRSQISMRPPAAPASTSGTPSPKPNRPQPATAPIEIVLISDASRFGGGTPELKYEWGAIDTGIVSQNIALFCAATGLATKPRASINKERLHTLLDLKETQHPFLEMPVGYPKSQESAPAK